MSRQSLRALIEMGDGKLSKLLGGHRRFTAERLLHIADFSGTTVDWLLTGRGRKPRATISNLSEQNGLRSAWDPGWSRGAIRFIFGLFPDVKPVARLRRFHL